MMVVAEEMRRKRTVMAMSMMMLIKDMMMIDMMMMMVMTMMIKIMIIDNYLPCTHLAAVVGRTDE